MRRSSSRTDGASPALLRPGSGAFLESRQLLRRAAFDLAQEVTPPRFGVLAAVAVQPAGYGGDEVPTQGYSVPRNRGDQRVDRLERVIDADGDVDAVGVDSAQIRARDGGELANASS